MSTCKFIQRLLKIKGFSVVHYRFNDYDRKLYLLVKPKGNGRLCPHCQKRRKIVYVLDQPRVWRDITICGIEVFFEYRPREILCPVHGRVQESIPWAAPGARVTYRFEHALLIYCALMTQKAAARLLKLAGSTLSDILHRTITRIRTGHKIRKLKMIGIDEISYCKGRKFATVVYDLEKAHVVWIGKGKGRDTIDRFFKEHLSTFQRNKIVAGCCDMSETYIGAIEKWCPNATLVLDRFHIVKALTGAVDDVRKEEWRKANAQERKILKGLRWLLYRHSTRRSPEDKQTLKSLYRGNRRIHRASVLKDEFEQFWDFTNTAEAESFLDAWCATASRSRLESIKTFVKTIRRHKARLLSFVELRLTNAVSEGLNRVIKIIKNRASGFRNLNAFSDLIFLSIGDLNIAEQIAPKFRTI
jgi:transposase